MQNTPLSPATPLDCFVGAYGRDSRTFGVISEHVDMFEQAGGTLRPAASGSGAQWALVPQGKGLTAYPVLCSEIIKVDTEDGPQSGRCGVPSVRHGLCEGHAEIKDSWDAFNDRDLAHWERQTDGSF